MTTISSNSSTGIVLTSPSYVNPILNTATIDVSLGIAMTGGGGIGWTVSNQGTIFSADATTSSSTLGVVSAGIDLLSGGNITNVGTGLIGGLAAIYSAGAATVVNSGMISGKITDPGVTYSYGSAFNIPPSLTQGAGIELTAGGSVINQAGGTITGFKGIYATNAGITVVNYGSIGGNTLIGNMGLASGGGVFLLTAGTVTNQTSGIITGYDPIGSAYGPITVVNDGKLLGQMTGGTGIAFGFGGGGTNLSNGTIAGYDAVYGYKAPVTFTNFGTVIGGTSGTHGAGVRLRTGGLVVNEGGKTISGFNGAYGGLDGPMTVLNAGLILATGTTLARGVLLTAGGYVSNAATGTIASTSNGNGVRGQNVAATIVNSGSILSDFAGRSAIALQNGGSVTNAVGGLIQGTLWNAIYGIGGTLVVSNAGRIAGTGTGTFSGGIVLAAGGTVTNLSGGTITAQTGIYTTLAAATVLNAGLIISAGTASARGVAMFDGGYVSNASTGTIAATGNGNAVRVQTAAGTVVNAGTLTNSFAGRAAVALQVGGSVTNVAGGVIQAGAWTGVYGTGASVTVDNAGLIAGNGAGAAHNAIGLKAGGTITNAASGTISAPSEIAVYFSGGSGTFSNAGLVTSSTQGGVQLVGGGRVTNEAGGTILAQTFGVSIASGPGTLFNAGTISGVTSAAAFGAGLPNRLIVAPGGSFSGTVDGGNTIGATAVSTMEFASGTSVGTLSGLGGQFVNFAQTTIDAGAYWSLTGVNALAAGTSLTNAGTLRLNAANFSDGGALINNGVILIDPSTLFATGLLGTGGVTIGAAGTLDVAGAIAVGETVAFGGTGANLHLGAPTSDAGSIIDFGLGETIDLAGINPATVSYAAGALTFAGGSIALSVSAGNTIVATTSADGALVTAASQALCFLVDTLIATPRGEVQVQALRVGDSVYTASGQVRPIRWIGVGCVIAHPGRRDAATPVIVRKGALAPMVPSRDLRVTKGHSLLLEDVLIPVEFLVNHRSILWDDQARMVSLFHIELDTHDVLIANGAPAESYRDDGNRWLFQNGNSGWGLPPQTPHSPVLTGGAIVDALWRRLLDRSGPRPGLPLTDEPDLHLLADGHRIDPSQRNDSWQAFRLPAVPAELRILSRAAVPQELGLARDSRCLGVAIRRITLAQGRHLRVIKADDPALAEGFHPFESEPAIRWTDGSATMPIGLFYGFKGPIELVLYVGGRTRYADDGVHRRAA